MAMPEAKKIIASLPQSIKKVGVFVEKNYSEIARCIEDLQLDFAQVHHYEEGFSDLKKRMILSIPQELQNQPRRSSEQYAGNRNLASALSLHQYHALLLDAPRKSSEEYGGTGQLSNWNLARKLSRDYRLLLAGGLNPQNIVKAIQFVNPYAVDVATGVELTPGRKCAKTLTQFLELCHEH